MADRKAVLNILASLNVPHLSSAFTKATDPTKKAAHRSWIDVDEIKDIVRAASRLGPQGIGAKEWQAILEIAKYDRIGPKAKTYLNDLERRWNAAKKKQVTPSGGSVVSLTHAGKYEGKVLGAAPYRGECAAGVQQIFIDAGKPLGLTRTWKQGVQVKGNNIAAGTAIASFKGGNYWKHAAIFIRETASGLEVWDQWAGQPWHKRTLRFNNGNTTDGSNNGNLFYVIAK